MRVILICLLFTVITRGEEIRLKLNGDETVLLLESINSRAKMFKIGCYAWEKINSKNAIESEDCIKILDANLISKIKAVDDKNTADCDSWIEVVVFVDDEIKAANATKAVLVKYRGRGGDSNVTYIYKKSGDKLKLLPGLISNVEILRTPTNQK